MMTTFPGGGWVRRRVPLPMLERQARNRPDLDDAFRYDKLRGIKLSTITTT